MITKEDLKQEIEQLDVAYLELVLNLLKQFPHQPLYPQDENANINRHAGKINLTQDPLVFQNTIRDEWM